APIGNVPRVHVPASRERRRGAGQRSHTRRGAPRGGTAARRARADDRRRSYGLQRVDRTPARARTPRARGTAPLSLATLRRHAVAWQGFSTRFRRADADDVLACVRRLSCVQLDSIAVVARSHVLVLASRAGAVEDGTVSRLLAQGRLFEYWAHEACLVPAEDWPLLRHRMRARRTHHWWGPVIDSDPALAARVLGEVRERGPLA